MLIFQGVAMASLLVTFFEISVPLRSKVKNLVCEQGELSRQVSFPFPCQTHKSIQVIGMFLRIHQWLFLYGI